MNHVQPGILASIPKFASYLFFHALPGAELAPALQRLADVAHTVFGKGTAVRLEHR